MIILRLKINKIVKNQQNLTDNILSSVSQPF